MTDSEYNPQEAIVPDDSERAEIAAFLETDETRLGDVYRGLKAGLDAEEIARTVDVKTSNFVWNYRKIIDALLDRDLPESPTMALTTARRYRKILKLAWSESVRKRLEDDLLKLERIATDVEALAEEAVTAQKQTADAEQSAIPGIYVYALPHYLRYRVDEDSGRTLLKVGHSRTDTITRFQGQTRTTALPEDPVLLRIYPTGDMDARTVENQVFRTLRAVDHDRSVQQMAGREWFLTSTRALDAIADLIGLQIQIVNDEADYFDE